jgi:23S rRNA maturation-related 3'-5' exoribonuclease YhaM
MQKAQRFTGFYRVFEMRTLIARNNNSYVRMRLEDAFGSIMAYGWEGKYDMGGSFADSDICFVEGQSRFRIDRWIVDLTYIQQAKEVGEGNATRFLPQSMCARPDCLPRLVAVTDQLSHPALKSFLSSIFLDLKLAEGFLTVPASQRHHHSYPGGLFVHSIECAEIVHASYPVQGCEKELGTVAALLHDIAKTRTMTATKRTTLGYVVEHDHLTLETLAPYLIKLEQTWPDGSIALRYLLTCNGSKKSLPLMPIAEAVKYADRVSSAIDARRLAYNDEPEWKRFARLDVGGPTNRFWSPSVIGCDDELAHYVSMCPRDFAISKYSLRVLSA